MVIWSYYDIIIGIMKRKKLHKDVKSEVTACGSKEINRFGMKFCNNNKKKSKHAL